MRRTLFFGAALIEAWLGMAACAQAQVFVRAPFVRVFAGDGGVAVRAPFVNLYVPSARPVYYDPYYGPPVMGAPAFFPPAPTPIMPPIQDDNAPPAPIQASPTTTLEAFAKSFQPKSGSYEVTLLNPTTGQPANVRFTLPEGTPRRVIVGRRYIEFVYHARQFVRIEFDRDGAQVITR